MSNSPKKELKKNPKGKKDKNSKKKRLLEFWEILKTAQKMVVYIWAKSPKHATGYVLTIIVISLLPFLSSWLNSKVIDELISVVGVESKSLETLFMLVTVTFLVMVVRNVNRSLNNYFDMNTWFDVGREMNYDVTKKLAYLDIEYYEDSQTMDLINKVKENYGHRPQQFMDNTFWLLDSTISVISAISILVLFKPLFIVILLLVTLPQAIVNIVYGRRNYGIWDLKGDIRRDYYGSRWYLQEEKSLMELKVFRLREYLLKRVYDLFYDFQKEQVKIENKRSLILVLSRLLSVAGYGVVFVITIMAVVAAEITVGTFNFYMSTAGRLQGSLNNMFRNISRMYEHGLYVKDIFTVLEFKEKIVSGEKILPVTGSPPKIEFVDVTFIYPGKKEKIFKNFNLVINPGEHIAIVGENGAGKTTMIKLLMRFYDVTSGKILIDGVDLKDLNLDDWYSKVGALFQEFNFYHFNARVNIGVGDVEKLDEFDRILDASKKSGAHSFIEKYDKKYEQILSREFKDGVRPSFGQKQKIALARTFFKDAPILILDEPTSAIDPKAEFAIFEKLFEFTEGKTVVIISHRFSTVRNANRIIVLDEGKIIEDGTHEELLSLKDGKYKKTFEIQKKGYE